MPENVADVRAAAAVQAGDADADGVVGAEHPAGRLGAGDGRTSPPAASELFKNWRRFCRDMAAPLGCAMYESRSGGRSSV